MQRFINNWAAALIAAAEPGDTELMISPEAASPLIGLGNGDHYVATAAILDETGAEVGWEILHITAATGGVLTVARGQEGTTARELPTSTQISVRLTAAAANAMIATGGSGGGSLTKVNFGQKIGNLSLANAGNFAYFDREIGELLYADFVLLTPLGAGIQTVAMTATGTLASEGGGAGATNDGNGFEIHTGTTSEGYVNAGARGRRIDDGTIQAALGIISEPFTSADEISSLDIGASLITGALSTVAQEYRLWVIFGFLDFSVAVGYERSSHGTNWAVRYTGSDYQERAIVSSVPFAAGSYVALTISAAPATVGYDMVIEAGGQELATLNSADMASVGASPLEVSFQLEKLTGTSDITLKPWKCWGRITAA